MNYRELSFITFSSKVVEELKELKDAVEVGPGLRSIPDINNNDIIIRSSKKKWFMTCCSFSRWNV